VSNLSKTKLGTEHRLPTQERLRELLIYEKHTGLLRWRHKRKGVPEAGMIAGCVVDGYVKISIDGTQYKAHHIIWCYMTGKWPVLIDHEDTDGENNRWLNLREATSEGNAQNAKSKKKAASPNPLKGAYFSKQKRRWHSRIMSNRKLTTLGFFDTPEEAHAAYCSAAKQLHGEFARVT